MCVMRTSLRQSAKRSPPQFKASPESRRGQMPAPNTPKEALARGYQRIANVSLFTKDKLKISPATFQQHRDQVAVSNPVDCSTAPEGTQCFSWNYPDGTHVVGYCENGTCTMYSGTPPT
jgi:hypothetical protein